MTIIRNFANTAAYISANGQYPAANVTGLAAVATSGSASDITTGTLPASVYTAGATGIPVLNVYTSSATWTKPATVKAIKVTVVGGGGNGGTVPTGIVLGGAGGGGGGTSIQVYPAPSLPGPQPYTVGGAGATSSFGVAPATVISATGGSTGAVTVISQNSGGLGGTGGSGSSGQVNMKGSSGAPTNTTSTPTPVTISGQGGSSSMGGGALGVNGDLNSGSRAGTAGGAYGGGGSGSVTTTGGFSAAGGAGAAGVVIVEEFY